MNKEQDPYYGRPECSNSDLSMLNKYWQPLQIIYDIEQVQNFGTLLDCMITDTRRVDFFKYVCAGVQHSKIEFEHAENMKKVFFRDDLCTLLHQQSDMQRVTIRERFPIHYAGLTFYLPFRMKADFNAKDTIGIIADLKSTNETTQKGFQQAVRNFEYHRQAAVYMDMEGVDRFVIIGISKKNLKMFKVTIERGDELYSAGRERYEELAFRYYTLFYHLQLPPMRIAA